MPYFPDYLGDPDLKRSHFNVSEKKRTVSITSAMIFDELDNVDMVFDRSVMNGSFPLRVRVFQASRVDQIQTLELVQVSSVRCLWLGHENTTISTSGN